LHVRGMPPVPAGRPLHRESRPQADVVEKTVSAGDAKRMLLDVGSSHVPSRGGMAMTFLIRPGVPFYGRQIYAQALNARRAAADLVWKAA